MSDERIYDGLLSGRAWESRRLQGRDMSAGGALEARAQAGAHFDANGESAPLILLLQGPVGPLFRHLMHSFRAQGYAVLKVNFNGGDWLFAQGGDTLNFSGSIQRWKEWIESFLSRSKPKAIVLFGDGRLYHRIAIAAARNAGGVPVWCLEEGYVRPHFITCEPGGNNALSPLRRPLDAPDGDVGEWRPSRLVTGNLFLGMARYAAVHAIATAVAVPVFAGHVPHRQRGLLSEALLWSRSLWRKLASQRRDRGRLRYLVEQCPGRYFVVALQVHDDLQLVRHGRGWTMERLITETIQSFSRHADPGYRLVLKVHPMDRGHRSYRSFARRIARLSGCADRVEIIEDGSIGLMIGHSLGVITVNSTSGLLALNHGKPVLALGDALYAIEGLAANAEGNDALDRFWRLRIHPDAKLVEAFFSRMYAESQINGCFYLRDWLAPTAEQIAARITAAVAQRNVTDRFASAWLPDRSGQATST